MENHLKAAALLILLFAYQAARAQNIEFHYVRGSGCINSNHQGGLNLNYLGECGNLENADLRKKDLAKLNMRGANLINSDLGGSNLRGADLRGANLTDANIFNKANFQGAVIDQNTVLSISTEDATTKFGMVFTTYDDIDAKLILAARALDLAGVKDAIENLADVNAFRGEAISLAVRGRHTDMVTYLISRGANPNWLSSSSDLPTLAIAVKDFLKEESDTDREKLFMIIAILLSSGADLTLYHASNSVEISRFKTAWHALLTSDAEEELTLKLYDLFFRRGLITADFLNNAMGEIEPSLYSLPYISAWSARSPRLLRRILADGASLTPTVNGKFYSMAGFYFESGDNVTTNERSFPWLAERFDLYLQAGLNLGLTEEVYKTPVSTFVRRFYLRSRPTFSKEVPDDLQEAALGIGPSLLMVLKNRGFDFKTRLGKWNLWHHLFSLQGRRGLIFPRKNGQKNQLARAIFSYFSGAM